MFLLPFENIEHKLHNLEIFAALKINIGAVWTDTNIIFSFFYFRHIKEHLKHQYGFSDGEAEKYLKVRL